MKYTKSMIYKESHEATDLYLYTVNTGYIYRQYTLPVIQNMQKKLAKGVFDNEKALASFYRLANIGANLYCKEFCCKGTKVGSIFSVTARFTAAVDMLGHYIEQIFENYND